VRPRPCIVELFVREAFPAEQVRWETARAKAAIAGNTDADGDWALFLVPVGTCWE
jgi:hypothetical protein